MEKNCGNCAYWDEKHKIEKSDGKYKAKCLWDLNDDNAPNSLLHHEIYTSYMCQGDGIGCPTFKERK